MKSGLVATLAIVTSLFLSQSVSAQPVANSNQVEGAASFFRPVGSGSGAFNGDFIYGRYLDDPHFELGVRQSITYNYNDRTPDVWNAVTAPYFNYNFREATSGGQFIPYVGGLVGAVYNDDDLTGTVGPQGGARLFLNTSTFVSANYRYEWFFDQLNNSNDSQNANHVLTIGLGYTWK